MQEKEREREQEYMLYQQGKLKQHNDDSRRERECV